MKNASHFFKVSLLVSFILGLVLLRDMAYGQKKTKEETLAAFPANISGIFSTSCVYCHSDQSSSCAKMFMNLSNWDKMKAKKQEKKGKQINKKVSKGAMPPKGFLEKHPDAALTPEQKKIISDWVNTISKNQ